MIDSPVQDLASTGMDDLQPPGWDVERTVPPRSERARLTWSNLVVRDGWASMLALRWWLVLVVEPLSFATLVHTPRRTTRVSTPKGVGDGVGAR